MEVPLTKGTEAYGKDVWSRRPEVGVDGGNSARLTGESALYAVKPLRRECRMFSAALYAHARIFYLHCA